MENIEVNQTPAKLGYGPLAAVTVTVAVYFLSQLIVGFGAGLIFSILGWGESRVEAWYKNEPAAQFLLILAAEAVTVWMIWKFLSRRKTKWSQIGWARFRPRDIGYAIFSFAVYYALLIAVTILVKNNFPGLDLEQEQQLGFDKSVTGSALLFVFASLVLLPAIVEEVVCRGFLYTGLKSKLPKIIAAIITSVLFAAAHLQWGSGAALLWVAALDTFILSMVLVYIREKTGSLWSPILVHMGKNGLAFTALFILKI